MADNPQPRAVSLPDWLGWSRRLQAIAQTGLYYSQDVFDRERYEEVRRLAAEIAAAQSNAAFELIETLFATETGYITPKIDVRGVVFRDDKILMVQEKSDGGWTLPGGWADPGSSPAEMAVREIHEESGYETRALKILGVFDRDKQGHDPNPFACYKLLIRCELTGGSAQPNHETTGVDFFAEAAIPPLSTTRVMLRQIQRCFEHLRQPDLPTDFD
jgi:ADP-ribose pyrophosphatase YjhB (NUDIX family)